MKPVGPLHLEPRRSRWALGVLLAAYVATAVLFAALPLPAVLRVAGLVVLALTATRIPAGLAGGPTSAELVVGLDRRLVVVAGDGQHRRGTIVGDSYVGRSLVTIVWHPDGARWSRSLLVAADSLPAAEFRALRVVLRYGREPVADPGSSDATTGSGSKGANAG